MMHFLPQHEEEQADEKAILPLWPLLYLTNAEYADCREPRTHSLKPGIRTSMETLLHFTEVICFDF